MFRTYVHGARNTQYELEHAQSGGQEQLASLEEVREFIRERTRHRLEHAKLQVQHTRRVTGSSHYLSRD